jgi:hypothetical protein
MINKHVNLRRPSVINGATDNLPILGKSLYRNILEYNFPAFPGVERQEKLTPRIVAKTIKKAGWLLQNFMTIATTVSATGLTVLDTLWYKPYESALQPLNITP